MVVLLVSGSTRSGSLSTGVLALVSGLDAVMYEGLVALPAFVPEDDESASHSAVLVLRQSLAAADGVLFCTPEYAGGLPGSLKNLLDWTVGTGELYGKLVGWINAANDGRGDGAQTELQSVLTYVGAHIVTEACKRITDVRDAFERDDLESVRAVVASAVDALKKETGS